jgi:predicted nucleic acid-binding protein
LIEGCQDDPLDEARAREVGERLGKRSRTDIADAHVVSCALKHNAAVVTSDSNDIEELAAPDEDLVVVAI